MTDTSVILNILVYVLDIAPLMCFLYIKTGCIVLNWGLILVLLLPYCAGWSRVRMKQYCKIEIDDERVVVYSYKVDLEVQDFPIKNLAIRSHLSANQLHNYVYLYVKGTWGPKMPLCIEQIRIPFTQKWINSRSLKVI